MGFENKGIPGTANLGLAKVKKGGLYVCIAGDAPTTTNSGKKIQFFLTDSSNYKFLDAIKQVVDSGKLRPVIQESFTLNKTAAAFDLQAAGHVTGKLSILPLNCPSSPCNQKQ